MTNKEKIQKFITDNSLDFTDAGSNLNGNCVILAGYADYLEYDSHSEVIADMGTVAKSSGFEPEFERVFDYAYDNNYGNWWMLSTAKTQYTFEEK